MPPHPPSSPRHQPLWLCLHRPEPVNPGEPLHHLALRLGRLTPHIVLAPPDVLLEIHASLRLFGGLRPLLRQALACTEPANRTRLGLAATPLAARLLARHHRGPRHCLTRARTQQRLQALPLALLAEVAGLGSTAHASSEWLHALGARTLADLAALPRSGLSQRGAGPWLQALDRALGQRPDPQTWFVPPEHFALRHALAWRAEDATTLDTATAPLLTALCGWLALRWQAAQRLSLRLHHEHGARRQTPDQVITLDLATPSRDIVHLQRLLRERLQRLPLAAAVDAVSLHLDITVPLAGHALTLLPEAPQPPEHTLLALVDRLQARLGTLRVWQLVPHADARPEQADRLHLPKPQRPQASPSPDNLPRPDWLLRTPLPLAAPHDQPNHHGRPLRLLGRPERIEHGWHDGHLVRRDYHVALDTDGTLLWVYRERMTAHTPPDAPPGWFLHGIFG